MPLVNVSRVAYEIGDRALLKDAELTLDRGDRVALIGRNGAGKSTLLRLIQGEVSPDAGEIRRAPEVRTSRLDQFLPEPSDESVASYVGSGLSHLKALVERYHRRTAEPLEGAALRELEELSHRIETEGGWSLDQRVETLLGEMELPGERPLRDLSGGWRRRAALARALVARPDVLLLDEPTNHLDVSTIEWLEARLRGFPGAILFVTHDRAFLQRLADRIVELDRAALTSWPGDYESFLRRKEEALEVEARAHALFDKRLAEEEAWIRQGIKARRTRNEGRVRALEAMREEYRRRESPEATARLRIEAAEASGRRVIELDGVSHGFSGERLFDNLSLKILRGDRLGIVGNNGVGKTTLLRILLGELEPDEGRVEIGVRLEVAYFDQLRREFDPTKTVAEIVADGAEQVRVHGKDRHVVGYLKDFLFTPERAVTKLGALSGGERHRVILARLFARPSNLLVLDEPTNDLDLETLEVLEARLADYEGTLLVVSHDRAFLDNVVTSTLVFEESGVKRYPGGFSDWARKGKRLAVKERAETASRRPSPETRTRREPAKPPARPAKLSYKLKLELEALPEKIAALEEKLEALESRSAAPDFYARPFAEVEPVLEEIAETQEALEQALERWMELEEMQAG